MPLRSGPGNKRKGHVCDKPLMGCFGTPPTTMRRPPLGAADPMARLGARSAARRGPHHLWRHPRLPALVDALPSLGCVPCRAPAMKASISPGSRRAASSAPITARPTARTSPIWPSASRSPRGARSSRGTASSAREWTRTGGITPSFALMRAGITRPYRKGDRTSARRLGIDSACGRRAPSRARAALAAPSLLAPPSERSARHSPGRRGHLQTDRPRDHRRGGPGGFISHRRARIGDRQPS